MPTTTTRPAAETRSMACGQDGGLAAGLDHQRRAVAAGPVLYLVVQGRVRGPGHALGAEPLGQIAPGRQRVDAEHPGARGRPPRASWPGRSARRRTPRPARRVPVRRGPGRAPRSRRARRRPCCRGPGHRRRTRSTRGPRAAAAGRRRGARRPGGIAGTRWAFRPGRDNSCRRAAAARWQPGRLRPRFPCRRDRRRSRRLRGPVSADRSRVPRKARPRHRKTDGSPIRRYLPPPAGR